MRDFQAWTKGLVALSKTKGNPIEAVSRTKMWKAGWLELGELSNAWGASGKNAMLTTSSAMCAEACRDALKRRVKTSA